MTARVRIAIDLPPGMRVADFERDLSALARKYGTNLQRSADLRPPARYVLAQRSPTRTPTGAACRRLETDGAKP